MGFAASYIRGLTVIVCPLMAYSGTEPGLQQVHHWLVSIQQSKGRETLRQKSLWQVMLLRIIALVVELDTALYLL